MYQRILVPVDGSPTSMAGLQEALKLARLARARLDLVHVVDELSLAAGFEAGGGLVPERITLLRQAGQKIIDDASAIAAAAGVTCDSCLIETLADRVATVVVREAEAWHADLIVLGTHGRRGLQRFVLGSDAEQILRVAPVPVLLVRGERPGAPATLPQATQRDRIASPA